MIEQVLKSKLSVINPTSLDIIDDSHKHYGHQPHFKGSGTHFKLTIVAECFSGKNHLERHKIIYKILQDEMENGLNDKKHNVKGKIHALSIKALAPNELI